MEEKTVRDAINAFYKGAGIKKRFTGKVNERVAEIFGQMLVDTKKCSRAFAWIPTPSGGKASLFWLAKNLTRSVIARLENKEYMTCARGVAYKWSRQLDIASMGL